MCIESRSMPVVSRSFRERNQRKEILPRIRSILMHCVQMSESSRDKKLIMKALARYFHTYIKSEVAILPLTLHNHHDHHNTQKMFQLLDLVHKLWQFESGDLLVLFTLLSFSNASTPS